MIKLPPGPESLVLILENDYFTGRVLEVDGGLRIFKDNGASRTTPDGELSPRP